MFLQLKLASAKESLGWMRPSNGFHTKGSRRRHRKQRKQHSQSISLTSCWILKCPLVNCWWYQYKASVFCAFWFLCPFPSMQVKFDMLSYHSCSIIISRVLFATACSILRICVYIHTHHTQYIYISIYLPTYLSIYQRKLGSNTSELRMTFTWWNWLWWRVVRDLTIHSMTIHNKRIRSGGIDLDEGW